MNRPITKLLLLIVCTKLFSQRVFNVDSAKKRLHVRLDNTAKANLLHQIAGSYQFSNTDSAFHYTVEEYDLAQRLNYSKGLVNAYGDFSDYYSIQGNGARMLEYAYKVRPIAERLNDRLLIAYCYNPISRSVTDIYKIVCY